MVFYDPDLLPGGRLSVQSLIPSPPLLPQNYLWLFELNPLYVLVKSYRAIFLEASAPPWTSLGYLTAGAAFLFIAGHAWFYKLKRSFADVV